MAHRAQSQVVAAALKSVCRERCAPPTELCHGGNVAATTAMSSAPRAILFDVDGTLVDSNDAHADAWVKAFTKHGVNVDWTKVRRCIGMGGDKLMPEVSGLDEESPQGTKIAEARGEIFKREFLPAIKSLREAKQLVAAVKALGYTVVAASSAQKDELTALLKIAGAESLMDAKTSSDDAEESKPEPD